MKKNYDFIAVAGNIGSGKTTIAKLISKEFNYELFEEPVVDNRFLKDYYKDMKRWSFTLQMEFLFKRMEHHKIIEQVQKNCIQDRSLIEDPLIFANYLHTLGNMNDNEHALYLDYFNKSIQEIKQPNKIIYLKVDDENVLLHRIHNLRGRPEEKEINKEFLYDLNGFYRTFPKAAKSKYSITVHTIDVENLELNKKQEKEKFLETIEKIIEK